MNREFSFLHISDLHISNQPSLLRSEKELNEQIVSLYLLSLRKAVEYVIEKNLNALLIVGDLFESERIDPEIVEETFQILSSLHEIPVFIAPGNHDLYNTVYSESQLKFYGIRLPENIYIFNREELSYIELAGIRIFGCASMVPEYNPFSASLQLEKDEINIALCHGSLLNYLPEGKEIWQPFNEKDLLESGFDYIALGHYHGLREIRNHDGVIKAAYPGSLVPVTMKDRGQRGGLHVRVLKDANSTDVEANFISLGQIRLEDIIISLQEETTTKELTELLIKRFSQYNNNTQTIFNIAIKGFGFLDLEELYNGIREHSLHIIFNRADFFSFSPDDILSQYSDSSTIGIFARKMLDEIEHTDDENEKKLLKNALAYGLDALTGKKIYPRYED